MVITALRPAATATTNEQHNTENESPNWGDVENKNKMAKVTYICRSPKKKVAIAHLAETPFGFLPTTFLPRHTQ
jgi:hypothetical protein